MNKIDLREVAAEAPNRRNFVRKLGLAGVAATAAMQLKGQDAATYAINDGDILNFALNLGVPGSRILYGGDSGQAH